MKYGHDENPMIYEQTYRKLLTNYFKVNPNSYHMFLPHLHILVILSESVRRRSFHLGQYFLPIIDYCILNFETQCSVVINKSRFHYLTTLFILKCYPHSLRITNYPYIITY